MTLYLSLWLDIDLPESSHPLSWFLSKRYRILFSACAPCFLYSALRLVPGLKNLSANNVIKCYANKQQKNQPLPRERFIINVLEIHKERTNILVAILSPQSILEKSFAGFPQYKKNMSHKTYDWVLNGVQKNWYDSYNTFFKLHSCILLSQLQFSLFSLHTKVTI